MQAIYNKKNDLLSAVASNNVVDCVKHLVKYLSCRVFGQAIYRHMTYIINKVLTILILIKKVIRFNIYINTTNRLTSILSAEY